MPWQIELKPKAKRALARLDRPVQQCILDFLVRLGGTENPRHTGEALQGEHGLWKYRVGDYRLVARIQDRQLIVLVVKIGHRRAVYRDLPKN